MIVGDGSNEGYYATSHQVGTIGGPYDSRNYYNTNYGNMNARCAAAYPGTNMAFYTGNPGVVVQIGMATGPLANTQ